MNILICIQYYDADKLQAFRLAKMIGDIEKNNQRPKGDVRILMARRFDCPLTDVDTAVLLALERHVCVETWRSKTKWVGWPGGCNGLARDLLIELASSQSSHRADCVILLEPDCVPFYYDWINVLAAEWTLASSTDKWLLGAWRDSGGQFGHVNGNMVCRPDLAKLIPLEAIIGPDLAWDAAIAPYVQARWEPTESIANHFKSTNCAAGMIDKAVLVHGYKDNSAYDLAVKKLGL